MKATSTLEELDDFLREFWLEFCGHLSDFDIDGTTYTVTSSLRDRATQCVRRSQ